MTTLSSSDNFRQRLALLLDGDIDGWLELYADDAVHEFPFAPPDRTARLEGRSAISDHMRRLPSLVRFGEVHDLVVYEDSSSHTLIAECRLTGQMVATGAAFERTYVWVISFRDGKIVRFRDYMNPLALQS